MLDPYTGEATEMSFERIERILRQRFGYIMQIGDCESFGILIGKARADEEEPGVEDEKDVEVMARRVIFWQWTMSAPISSTSTLLTLS